MSTASVDVLSLVGHSCEIGMRNYFPDPYEKENIPVKSQTTTKLIFIKGGLDRLSLAFNIKQPRVI